MQGSSQPLSRIPNLDDNRNDHDTINSPKSQFLLQIVEWVYNTNHLDEEDFSLNGCYEMKGASEQDV
jgi:hypothetical protein